MTAPIPKPTQPPPEYLNIRDFHLSPEYFSKNPTSMSLMKKQTAFRIDETLLTQLNAIARIKDLSLNALVNDIISQYIEELRDSPTFMSEVDNLIKKDVAALKSLLPPT